MLTLASLAAALGGEVSGDQVLAPGPGHSPEDRSLSVKLVGDDVVVHSFAGDDFRDAKDYVREKVGLDEWKPNGAKSPVTAEYIYRLADDTPYLQVKRTRDKKFWQSHWTGSRWERGKPNGPKIPYRLPQLLNAEAVFVCEGEKDADRVASLGLAATTASEGAGKWAADLTPHFRGKVVYILPDNDEAGRNHAAHVAASLHNVAAEVRIVDLPDLRDKGDVSDWLDRGGSKEKLVELCRAAPAYTPTPANDRSTSPEGPVVTRLSDVEPQAVQWLWPGVFAIGKLSIVAGHPGLGKSQLTIDVTARVTRGRSFPGNSTAMPPRNVVMMSAEDDAADTIRPRFDAAGGDPSRVHVLEAVREGGAKRGFDLTRDIERLEQVVSRLGDVALIIVDPISAYLGGKLDSHRNTDVRFALAPLQELAARYGAAVIAVSHLAKTGGDAVTRVIGSMAFAAAARAVFLVARHPEMPEMRVFLPAKNNIGNDTTGLAFRIEERSIGNGLRATAVAWESGAVTMTADEALGAKRGGRSAGVEDAMDFLRATLSGGRRSTKAVEDEAAARGIRHETLKNARKKLGVVAKLDGRRGGQEWYLELPGGQPNLPI